VVSVLDDALSLAPRLALAAGELARTAFGSQVAMVAKTSPLDVVTEIDHAAERLIIAGLVDSFPDHTVVSEEAGARNGSSSWSWRIDPLDGTNNFAIGLPLYGLSMVLLHETRPVLTVVRDSHLGRQVVATADGLLEPSGGVRFRQPSRGALGTVALQQGYAVSRGDPALAAIRLSAESEFQRVLYTWSPSIDVLLLVSGMIGGIVSYRCTGAEHTAARFLAEKVGCVSTVVESPTGHDQLGTYVLGWSPASDQLTAAVKEAMNVA